jgi:MFS family permease
VLLVLASGQFLMTLDSSVMNVSISSVANDLGTTVTGIQSAITLYTLVMASLMLTGGKIGTLLGRRRSMAIGLVIYGAGSLTTALAPNLGVLLFGWSLLEGIGAALIMPAIVALVAGNFPPERRAGAYGSIAAAGAMAVAAGPLIGGAVTTFASWRYVFAGEVVIVIVILLQLRRIQDPEPEARSHLDLVGSVLSILGLGMAVFGVLRSAEWGWVRPKPGGPEVLGVSPVVWLILGGGLVLWLLFGWERRLEERDGDPLVPPSMLDNSQLRGGLTMFTFQYFIQAGVFFTIPLFLSVVLELSALATGARLVPLSVALLLSAAGIPKFAPDVSPRLVVRLGLLALLAGTLILIGGLQPGADASIVVIPMLLMGLGIGALASQLGSVTVSAVTDEESADVGGLQNTMTNLGASLGTALVGSVLIAGLTASFLHGVEQNPAIPTSVKSQASVELSGGVPFLSDTALEGALAQAGVPADVSAAALDENEAARYTGLRASLFVVAVVAVIGLLFTAGIPVRQPGAKE